MADVENPVEEPLEGQSHFMASLNQNNDAIKHFKIFDFWPIFEKKIE